MWKLLVLLLCLSGAAVGAPFEGQPGCFVLYDVTAARTVVRYSPARSAQRFPPCSTFKVPLALMAVDRGLIQDASTAFKWDGHDYGNDGWNRDQTAATWIRNSVVWVSQRLTPRLGQAVVDRYVAAFRYGNRDTSAGLTQFWLSSSLQISADEQVAFLRRLWADTLPVSTHARVVTRGLMRVETSPHGWVLSGKTGTGHTSAGPLGWFVGCIERGGRPYVFALNVTETHPHASGYAGLRCKALARQWLANLGYW